MWWLNWHFFADIADVGDSATTACPADAFGDIFVGLAGSNNLEVSGLPTLGNASDMDEVHGVCALDLMVAVSLC